MAEKIIKAGLVGVTGYTGMELARILAMHPVIRLTHVTSRAEAGKRLGDIYPFLNAFPLAELVINAPDYNALAKECDIVFLAVPHGNAMESAGILRRAGVKVIDLSADFRLRSPAVYANWYGLEHKEGECLREAVYGLPELYADQVKNTALVANPGCYPTASILGLYPALRHGLVDADGIVIDAKSGTSGAGRKAAVNNLFCEVADSFKPYSIGGIHRHTPEIEQELSAIAGQDITLSFNPHLLPVNRGILATIYTRLAAPQCACATPEKIHAIYTETYAQHRFVRVLPLGELPALRNVRGTMFCDIALTLDARTGRLIITSAIDNLCRGASGQAVANANLMCALPLETGLNLAPLLP